MTYVRIRGLIMSLCGVFIFSYAIATDIKGFQGFILTFGGGLLTREGYDWWCGKNKYVSAYDESND